MSNPRTTKRIKPDRWTRFQRGLLLISCGVVICSGLGLWIIGWNGVGPGPNFSIDENSGPQQPTGGAGVEPTLEKTAGDRQTGRITLIEDDAQTLWVPPAKGPPLDLAYLPPGSQVIAALQWPELTRQPELFKALLALGPLGKLGIKELSRSVLYAKPDMYAVPRMLAGFQVDRDGNWLMSRVAYYPKPFPNAQLPELTKISSDNGNREYAGKSYAFTDKYACYLPAPRHLDRTIIAPKGLITDIIDLDGNPPPLRRDMERLVAHTDADRHVTILFAPTWLFSEGQSMFTGQMAGLREPLFWFLGDEFSAVALSLHWEENFFVELIAVPTLDTSPERASRILAERLAEVPNTLETYLATLKPQPYGREILARFPAMVRTMVKYTRSGVDADHAVLRCYLPAVAGHNLLMGAELTLAETWGGARTVGDATTPSSARIVTPTSVRERLLRPTSLRLARDTLEAALEQLSQDIGVEIVIRGADLQADGITKNQSLAIDIENTPAEEILVEILRLANPDKTATSPSDPRQKLVYVIAATDVRGAEQVLVTTRAAAEGRGDELPSVFRPSSP
jgi:hypothetical protein